jgi:hypothetical protein
MLRVFLMVLSVTQLLFSVAIAQSKKKIYRDIQEVNFEEMNLKGTVRNPEGAFLVQKRGIKFMPLYDIQKDMDTKIRESVEYVR